MLYEVITLRPGGDFRRVLEKGPIQLELLHGIRSGFEGQFGKIACLSEVLAFFAKVVGARRQLPVVARQKIQLFRRRLLRITSYNVCYTKLLRTAPSGSAT